jgi:hypothetical protein
MLSLRRTGWSFKSSIFEGVFLCHLAFRSIVAWFQLSR